MGVLTNVRLKVLCLCFIFLFTVIRLIDFVCLFCFVLFILYWDMVIAAMKLKDAYSLEGKL